MEIKIKNLKQNTFILPLKNYWAKKNSWIKKYMYGVHANYKKLMKETKEDLNKWRHTLCSTIERLNIIETISFPQLTYRFNAISNQHPSRIFFFPEMDKPIIKFLWKCKDRLDKTILKLKLQKSHYENLRPTSAIKTVLVLIETEHRFRNRPTEIWPIDF